MNTTTLFSTGTDEWRTPAEVFFALDDEFDFAIDGAATAENTLLPMWFGPGGVVEDALTHDWPRAPIFVNPPYSRGLQRKFIEKAATERVNGATTVMLLPARTDTKAFHRFIWDETTHKARTGVEVRFLKGRIKFVGATAGAPFPSMIVVFRGQS